MPDTPVHEDTACIKLENHVISRERSKHMVISKHFAHDTIQNRRMLQVKVDTSNQLAKIFTKQLQLPS